MDNASVSVEKGEYKKEKPSNDLELEEGGCLARTGRSVRQVNPEDLVLLGVKKSQLSEFCIQKLFFQHASALNKRIPRQLMNVDDKYLFRCLELIHMSANPLFIPSEVNIISSTFSGSGVINDSRIAFGSESIVISSNGDSIIGSITGSESMKNILKSPLFRQLGSLDSDVISERTSPIDVKKHTSSGFMSSPGRLRMGPSKILQNERVASEYQTSRSELTSSNSTFSEQSCSTSSTSGGYCRRGTLHSSWYGGFPHYVFSVDDSREVYTTHLSKAHPSDDKGLDYMYVFHSRDGKKGNMILPEKESVEVGKMKVSTSFSLCPHNTEVMEIQFVLSASLDEMQVSGCNSTVRKQKGLFPSKVAEMFRVSHSYRQRQRTSSKFDGTITIPESSLEDSPETSVLSEIDAPNLEIAAIIMKKHISGNDPKEAEVGGWGMKFLKKAEKRQTINVSCEFCRRDTDVCAMSTDVLIPTGIHGGPRTVNGGPTSLIERWRTRHCDCGGWDVGCPLTVLHSKPKPPNNNKVVSAHEDLLEENRNTFDLFIQGSKQSAPVVKMVNIHDGFYYIHYQSTLSALQSLSIAVANIHSHSPTLTPKVYRN